MEFKVVAVEREDLTEKTIYGSSGILLNNKYVLCTANILLPTLNNDTFATWHSLTPGKLFPAAHMKQLPELRIICNSGDEFAKYDIKSGEIFAFFTSKDLKSTIQEALQGWAIDSPENSNDIKTALSLFVVIKISPTGSIQDLQEVLTRWWDLVKDKTISQSDEIVVKSAPFGNKIFLNSLSKGIVSNILGESSCLIVSDCPSTPGSEGSPVFITDSQPEVPVGIVMSSSCWWRGEWTGLTLIVNIGSVLLELLENGRYKTKLKNIPRHLTASIESTLLHVYSGSTRGTAIIIDATYGILLTNSHVISNEYVIDVYWRGQKNPATLIYKTPDDEVYDLAVLKCNPVFLKRNGLRSIKASKKNVNVGDEVICAGYAIFSKNVCSNPALSKGHVSYCNQSVIATTCCINSGMSGGAVLNGNGKLIGIIVCNTKMQETVYPHFNMAIPYTVIEKVIQKFLKSKDPSLLQRLLTDDPKLTSTWKYLEAKL